MKVLDGPVGLDDDMANYQVHFVFTEDDAPPPCSSTTVTVYVPVTVPLADVKKTAFQKAIKFFQKAGAVKAEAK